MECLHFKNSFHPLKVEKSLKALPVDKRVCLKCQVETNIWICLSCGVLSCGRFEKGHALEHYKETGHTVSIDLITLSSHCYVCDDYVHGGVYEQKLDELRKTITNLTSGLDTLSESDTKFHHVTGLENLGNTCYMNCILQILCYTKAIQMYYLQPLMSPMTPAPTQLGRITRSTAFAEHSLWTQFCKLLLEMWETLEKSIVPEEFLRFMRKSLPQFGGYQQQDAQEFLRALLDKMHSELETRKGRTMIMQLFQGHFMNQITCDVCHKVSRKKEDFLDLSLSIPETASPTLEDCIVQFIAPEKLAEADKYFCEDCKKLQTATKQLVLDTLPPILLFHLKRFKYAATRSKIDTHVKFPLKLNMEQFHLQGMYSLYGVVVHRGTSGQGHYLSYIHHQQQWYQVNDKKVTLAGKEEVEQQSAYMLFYELDKKRLLHAQFTPKKRVS